MNTCYVFRTKHTKDRENTAYIVFVVNVGVLDAKTPTLYTSTPAYNHAGHDSKI